jgi:Arc/MetJ-type ribon-helix-helix transcriptional regulator
MTIQLPADLERRIRAEVENGQFATEADLVAEAVREYFRRKPAESPAQTAPAPAGSLGAMRDDAEWLDLAVEHAMQVREERPWRLAPGE